MTLKNLYQFTLLLILTTSISFAQAQPKEITEEKLEEFKQAIEQDITKLRTVLEKTEYGSDFDKQRNIEFTIDTFRVERMMQLRLSTDFSTKGMSIAGNEAEAGYDALLNKYYQLLLNRLKDEDKETLQASQRNWIAFRDSEQRLNQLLANESYSGGGTIQNVIVMSRSLDITKKRVFEIHEYLSRFFE